MPTKDISRNLANLVWESFYCKTDGSEVYTAKVTRTALHLWKLVIPLDKITNITERTYLRDLRRVHVVIEYITKGRNESVIIKSMDLNWKFAKVLQKAIIDNDTVL